MFDFLKKPRKNAELEGLLERIENNMANNYKDAAQEYLTKYSERFLALKEAGALKEAQMKYYEDKLDTYKSRLKGFTHKDQKPYWT